jgi:hypothetical protein
MTLREDLKLTGNDFSNLVTATYVAIVVWEIPNSTDLTLFLIRGRC